jgi:hypothetical protein
MLSLAARYGDAIDEAALASYRYETDTRLLTESAVAHIKNIHCYQYQSCEHEGWDASMARQFCTALLASLEHDVPGYDDAPWGFSDSDAGAGSKVTRLV